MSYAGEFPSVTKTHMLTISRSCPVLACRAIAVRMLFILHPGKASTAERTNLDGEEDGEQRGAQQSADDEADSDEGVHVAAQRLSHARIRCVGAPHC